MLRVAARAACRRVSIPARTVRWNTTTTTSEASEIGEPGFEIPGKELDRLRELLAAKDTENVNEEFEFDNAADLELLKEFGETLKTSPVRKEDDHVLEEFKKNFDWKAHGLKHNPAELPLKRTLDPWGKPVTEEQWAMTLVHGRAVQHPFIHPRTHDVPVANIHFRSHHVELLNLFTHFALHAASSLGIPTSRVAMLPTDRTLWTVLRSPFAHKKSQENFERRVHKRAIKAWDADAEVVQRWVEYLRKHAMAGVGMKVTTWHRVPLGVGKANVAYPDLSHRGPLLKAQKEIKQLAGKIVAEELKAVSPDVRSETSKGALPEVTAQGTPSETPKNAVSEQTAPGGKVAEKVLETAADEQGPDVKGSAEHDAKSTDEKPVP